MQFSKARFDLARWLALGWTVAASGVLAQTNAPTMPPTPPPLPIQAPPRHRIILPANEDKKLPGPMSVTQVNGPTLLFDAETKQYNAKPFEMSAPFTFHVTNVWTNDITISAVKASCGCTTAHMPATPWVLHPREGGAVEAKVNLLGKMGTITKTLTFYTSVGLRVVNLRVVIPSPENAASAGAPDRKAAMAQAAVDPQAIFKGDCARCHVEKGREALGENLYAADCGICHESSHRESIVPDLHALKQPTNLEYWKTIITFGKAHSLMPAFAMAQGGPLTDQQVNSLAGYLNRVLSHNIPMAPMTNAAAPHQARFAAQE
jgi:mono/diheme cytochrome c family protein